MRRFLLKTVLLMAALFCVMLYGMTIAKKGIVEMKGVPKQTETTSSLWHFNIPELAGNQTDDGENNINNTEELDVRLTKLKEVERFNPYTALSGKLSQGVSAIFKQGIDMAASVLDRITGTIL